MRRRINERRQQSCECGFTLIEVMLAVTLSAFLIAMIASAIHLNVTVLQKQQIEIERSQIARNVLMMIKSDIRAAIQYTPADVTGLDSLTVSQEAIAGIAAATGGDPAAALGGDQGAPEEEPQSIGSQQSEFLRPGLYGNSTELMLDISRLPRVDQYNPLVLGVDDQNSIELPTDVKTISYFVSASSEQTVGMKVGQDSAASGGLYRRQLDRAVAAYSSDLAATLAAIGNTKLIANEVIAIQFRYFNGEDWQDQWNSQDDSGFPKAIEVTVVVDNERPIGDNARYSIQRNVQNGDAWRLVVNIPASEIVPESESEGAAGGRP